MPRIAHNRNTPAKFWARVAVRDADECWPWLGKTNQGGYGTLSYQGNYVVAHRVAAYLNGLVATIAAPVDRKGPGHVLHACDNPRCCNPAHFEVGTLSKNLADAYLRKRKSQPRSAHANAKLQPYQVRLIRKSVRNEEHSQESWAYCYGVSQVTISNIVLGRTYRDV